MNKRSNWNLNTTLKELCEGGCTIKDLIDILHMENVQNDDAEMVPRNGEVTLHSYITEMIKDIGIPANILGFGYVRHAIMLAYHDGTYMQMIHKKLYPAVATKYNTTPSRVERAIRHAIEVASNNCNEKIPQYFGSTIPYDKVRPTNSQFIAMLVEKLHMEYRDEQ